MSSVGLKPSQREKLMKAGLYEKTGRTILDKKVVTALSSLDDIAEKATEEAGKAGKVIGDVVGAVDDSISALKKQVDSEDVRNLIDETFGFNLARVADKIDETIVKPNAFNDLIGPEVQKMSGLTESFRQRGALSLAQGQAIKGSQRLAAEAERLPKGFQKQVYSIIRDEMTESVSKAKDLSKLLSISADPKTKSQIVKGFIKASSDDALQEATNKITPSQFLEAFKTELDDEFMEAARLSGIDDKMVKDYVDALKSYAVTKSVADAATKRVAVEAGQRQASLTDHLLAMVGFADGGIGKAILFGALNKMARKYGAQGQAVIADRIANFLDNAPGLLKQTSKFTSDAVQAGGLSVGAARGLQELINRENSPAFRLPRLEDSAQGFQLPRNGAR